MKYLYNNQIVEATEVNNKYTILEGIGKVDNESIIPVKRGISRSETYVCLSQNKPFYLVDSFRIIQLNWRDYHILDKEVISRPCEPIDINEIINDHRIAMAIYEEEVVNAKNK